MLPPKGKPPLEDTFSEGRFFEIAIQRFTAGRAVFPCGANRAVSSGDCIFPGSPIRTIPVLDRVHTISKVYSGSVADVILHSPCIRSSTRFHELLQASSS